MTKQQKANVIDTLQKAVNEETKPTKKEIKDIQEMFKLAKQPVELTNDKFTLGDGEIDIRQLSDANYKQMMFRLFANTLTWSRNLHTDFVDCLKLLMLICEKLGIENILEANEKLEKKNAEQVKEAKKEA